VLDVAPLIAAPFRNHWYINVPEPEATTLNVAVAGAVTVWLTGCARIVGTVFTVSVAAVLVTDPTVFVTITVYSVPLLLLVVAAVV
jgi:hypothetical protein